MTKKFDTNVVLKKAGEQSSYLQSFMKDAEKRGVDLATSSTYIFNKAKLIGMLDMLDILGVDRSEFNWIF